MQTKSTNYPQFYTQKTIISIKPFLFGTVILLIVLTA